MPAPPSRTVPIEPPHRAPRRAPRALRPRPPSWSPAARWRWAPTRPRMRAASPSCCRPARRCTSIICRAAISSTALPALVALRQAGLEPVPHIAARRVASREQVQSFLQRAVEDGRRRQGAADRRRRGRAGRPLRLRGGAAARRSARRLRHPADRVCRLSGGPSAHPDRDAARRARREAGAGPRAGAGGLRRHPVLASRRTASPSIAPSWPGARPAFRSTSAWPGRRTRSPCCAMRSAAASAPRCAPCSRRAWGPCGSSRTPIRASSSRRSPAIAAAAAPATWWACISTASAASPAPRAG